MHAQYAKVIAIALGLSVICGCRGENAGQRGSMAEGDLPRGMELGIATYSARHSGGTLFLTAKGYNPSPGYSNRLVPAGNDTAAPEFIFCWGLLQPDRPTLQILTPFSIEMKFPLRQRADSVVVRDRDGKHVVAVAQGG